MHKCLSEPDASATVELMRGYQRLVNKTGEVNVCIAFALKGQNEIAQGSALGKWHTKTPSPERAKGVVKWYCAPSGLI